jgi:hypothetical protein
MHIDGKETRALPTFVEHRFQFEFSWLLPQACSSPSHAAIYFAPCMQMWITADFVSDQLLF